jgi:hypothetical protein
MQHCKHAILQQNISILIHQFGSGFFMKGTVMNMSGKATSNTVHMLSHPLAAAAQAALAVFVFSNAC